MLPYIAYPAPRGGGGGGGGGEGPLLYGLYGDVPLDRVWFLSLLS